MKYDVAVIGSGPGGYVAAIRCAQLGFKTVIIEKYNSLGGTCLNVGCIPSKALLDSSEHVYKAQKEFGEHGINISSVKVDFKKMIARKDAVVNQTNSGIDYLMKKNNIDVVHGTASFESPGKILVTPESQEKVKIEAGKVIIATGSKPAELPSIKIDKERIISSTKALELNEIPGKLIIIGGGIIGVELGSVYARLGSEVSIVEYLDRIIPSMDSELSKELFKVLKKQGIKFFLSHKVNDASVKGKSVTVNAEDKNGKSVEFKGDYCLLSVGRRPYTEGLNLDAIGVKLDDKGMIRVNENLETDVKGIFAIGDVIRGAMLAHKAEEEGILVAEFLAGQRPHINYNLIPSVAYTWPEVASVGFTEEQLKDNKVEYKTGKFPFKASGRARASMDTDGFVKVIADKSTDEILGMHMIGPRIADLIIEGVVAMEYRASAEDIARMSHPHPTFSEAVKEACLAATENRAIHV